MFGMGFTEILFIAVVAILFLGPDKLPEAMVQIAKFFKTVRSTVNEAKSSFEEEVRIKELREEALGYRKKIEEASHDIAGFKNAIPNPAAELQDAITSISSDRYLDEDILADISAAEEAPDQPAEPIDEPDAQTAPEDHTDKSAPSPQQQHTKNTAQKSATFKHLDDGEPA